LGGALLPLDVPVGPGAGFADGRAAVVSTAIAMGWTSNQIDAINDAFDEVGIEDTATVTV